VIGLVGILGFAGKYQPAHFLCHLHLTVANFPLADNFAKTLSVVLFMKQ
jgi:hypothetical protein